MPILKILPGGRRGAASGGDACSHPDFSGAVGVGSIQTPEFLARHIEIPPGQAGAEVLESKLNGYWQAGWLALSVMPHGEGAALVVFSKM